MRLVSTVFSIAVRGMWEKRFYEEHLSSILRRNRPASRTVRAVLLRQRPAHSICFILVKRGAHNWMKVSETVAIRTLRPPGYMGKKNSGLLGTSARRQQQSKHGSLGGLLAVWACATHSVLDSTLLTSCKRPAQAVLRLAGLVAMVVGYVRQSNGYRHVDRLLKRFRLPPRQIRWFKCPDEESMQRARLTVRSAAASLAQKHGTFLFHWVMNRVHFCVGAPRRLADRRNAAQQSKLLPVSTLWNQGCAIEHYKRGFEVKNCQATGPLCIEKLVTLQNHTWKARWNIGFNNSIWTAILLKSASSSWLVAMEGNETGSQRRRRITWTIWPSSSPTSFSRMTRIRKPVGHCRLHALVPFSCRWSSSIPNGKLPRSPSINSAFWCMEFLYLQFQHTCIRAPCLQDPYVYPFVKSKCFWAAGGHICQKPRHSCVKHGGWQVEQFRF